MTTAYFSGKVKWAKLRKPDQKYNKYTVDVLLDMKQFKEMKDLGLKNGGKPDDSGKMWVTFRRNKEDGAPAIVDASGDPVSTDIGNGSVCTVKLGVETFVSPRYGKVTRSIMESVRIDKLVIYDPEAKASIDTDGSNTKASASTNIPSIPRPRIPF